MGTNISEWIDYCARARKMLVSSRRKLFARLLPSADPRNNSIYRHDQDFRIKFMEATRALYLAEEEMLSIIETILREYDSQEEVVRECEEILRVDNPLWSDAKATLPTFFVPGATLPMLVLHAVMRDLVKGHLRLAEVIKKGTELIRERLGEQMRDVEEALATLQWLFRVFAIYPRARSEYLHELRAAAEDILKIEGIDIFYDAKLCPAESWNDALQEKLDNSDVVVALLCEEFFASDYIEKYELKFAGDKLKDLRGVLIPLFFADCKWNMHPLIKRIQIEPRDKPILSLYPTADERKTYLRENLARGVIVKIFRELSNQDSAALRVEALQKLRKELESP